MDKKLQSKICILLFILILVLPSVVWTGIKLFNPSLYRTLNYDLGENRRKQMIEESDTLPVIFSEIEEFVSDRAPFRSLAIDLCHSANSHMDKLYQDKISPRLVEFFYGKASEEVKNAEVDEVEAYFTERPAQVPVLTPKVHEHEYELVERIEPTYTSAGRETYRCIDGDDEYTITIGKLIDDSYFPPVEYEGGILRGRYGWLFYTGNNSIEYYRGSNLLEAAELEEYAEKVRKLQDICDEKNIQLALMFMPNKEQVYPEYMPSYDIANEYKRTQRLVDYINAHTDTVAVYPLKELRAADVYHQVYYKYDTHWNHMGALVGLQCLNKALNRRYENPAVLEGYEEPAEMAGDFKLAGLDPDDFEEDTEYIAAYRLHIALSDFGDIADVNYITSTYETNEKAVLIGDSFRINMMPFMAKDYNYTVFAHRDNVYDIADDVRSCNVLVISAVERYDYQVFDTIDDTIAILQEE